MKNLDQKLKHLKTFLKDENFFFNEDFNIKNDTYFKYGGTVKVYTSPNTLEDFKKILIFLRNHEIDFKVIGFSSNIIFLREICYSVVICTKNLNRIRMDNGQISVETGYSLQEFVRVASILYNAKGFEGLEGIPGTVGGGVFMNAAAYGDSISDNLISVTCLDQNDKIVSLKKEECAFKYRSSIFNQNPKKYIILGINFRLQEGNRSAIKKNIEKFHIARHSYQDFVYPSLGSIISINKNIYREIYRNKSQAYFLIHLILEVIFKNPISKFISRKRPSNYFLNLLFLRFIKQKKLGKINNTISDKTINTLINDGEINGQDIVNFILLLHDLTNRQYSIENELVIDSVYRVSEDFEKSYNEIQRAFNEKK
ncbi:MAG: hypothetical protein CMD13_02560 [Flavobacteriales bacterium]|nr:hypothetical protein [Flavobacteriales bacterium]